MDIAAFASRLRGSNDWRDERDHFERMVKARPDSALEIANALDTELAAKGFDVALQSLRQDLLDLVVRLPEDGDATEIAVRMASRPPMSHPSSREAGTGRPRGAITLLPRDRPGRSRISFVATC
jgi:hypothetical protein